MAVTAIAGVELMTCNVATATAFYVDALGFRPSDGRLWLGAQAITLAAANEPAMPYPEPRTSHDPWFQHFAIVTPDIALAYRRLCAISGWQPITLGGPRTLPASSGGVTAFKFRDPEGHPLELLSFPRPGADPGIDHTAIVVADTDRSVAFYQQIGFSITSRSRNVGPAQEALDAAPGVLVEVTAMSLHGAPPPHLELLCYHAPAGPAPRALGTNNIARTRIVFAADHAGPSEDPDQHLLAFQHGHAKAANSASSSAK